MAEPDGLLLSARSLSPVIQAVAALLDAAKVPGALIGAAAVGMLSEARLTRDVDALVMLDLERWPAFLEQAGQFGLVPRIADCLKFARKSRILLLRHQPSGVGVDISLGALPFEQETADRAKRLDIEGTTVPVASPEDLIVMKAVAGRSKDYADIGLILNANPRVDKHRIRRWVRQFAQALEMPEIAERLESHLAANAKRAAKIRTRRRPRKP